MDAKLASALDVAPNAAKFQQKARAVAAYAASNPAAHAAVVARLKTVVPEFKEYATKTAAPYRDHWLGGGGQAR